MAKFGSCANKSQINQPTPTLRRTKLKLKPNAFHLPAKSSYIEAVHLPRPHSNEVLRSRRGRDHKIVISSKVPPWTTFTGLTKPSRSLRPHRASSR
ncbi:hypothetical protein AVEN_197439-1 [Araneus ventricosus]|uniref:Uncharacterized protein n=1 Tax=Araneus ventricosus TaxID=182803 RepID=A0A4Y2IBI6_ARAVE|nr:hypothetical protein AVEN_197439-1 [Araneus ventricosus]